MEESFSSKLDDIFTVVSFCSQLLWKQCLKWLFISGIWLNLILWSEHGFFHTYLIKNIPCGLRYCTNTKIALYFPFFLEEFIKRGLKQYVGSVQVQVTLKLRLWNSPEGPGCLVPHDVMQALPFQQNNSVFTACN